tara:strand:+ start:579 stop:1397 length:819 start_codon:yes stop_codon:yes gene_type:complete
MPELPEVQTVVNHLKNKLIGKTIISLKPIWPKVFHNFKSEEFFKINSSAKILDVKRRAKFIIIQLKNSILAIHLRMTGKLYFLEGKLPKHTSAEILLDNKKKLIFQDTRKFGRFYLYKNLKYINKRHGPEPLEKKFTKNILLKILTNSKRNIKALLLDQSKIAGLGNIYVDESLWLSNIHPNSLSNLIPKKIIFKLHHSIQHILNQAISYNGTTIIDFSYVNEQSGNYSNQLNIYGKKDLICSKCKTKIKKIKVANRGTYHCKCQKIYRNNK